MPDDDAIGYLGLETKDFVKALDAATLDVKRLQPEVNKATAELKLLERQMRQTGGGSDAMRKSYAESAANLAVLKKELSAAKGEQAAFGKELGVATQRTSGTAKSIGFMGTAVKLALAYFAGTKVKDFALDLLFASTAAKQLEANLKEANSARGSTFQSQSDISEKIGTGKAAVAQANEKLGLSDITDPAKEFQSAWSGAILGVSDKFTTLYNSIFNNDTREINSAQKVTDARRMALEEIGKLQQQLNDKIHAQQMNQIIALNTSQKQADLEEIERRKKEALGGVSKLEKSARPDAIKNINAQAELETGSANKKYFLIAKELEVRNKISRAEEIGYGQQDIALQAQIDANNDIISVSEDYLQATEEEKAQLMQQNEELLKQQKVLRDNYRLERNIAAETTQVMASQLSQGQRITRLAQIELQYRQAIAQAAREGKMELVAQLETQKALAKLQANISLSEMTPQERARQRQADRTHARITRQEISRQTQRDKSRGYNRSDSRTFRSPRTEAMVADFEKAHGGAGNGMEQLSNIDKNTAETAANTKDLGANR